MANVISIGRKTKEFLTYHCGCHGNLVTIATRYVADAYCPKEAQCQILNQYGLRQRSYKVRKLISAGKVSWDHFLSSEAPLIFEKTFRHWEYLLSSGVPLIIGKTSRHWEFLLSSGVPLIIRSTSYHQEYLLSSGVSLIIRSISYHQEYLLSSERPLVILSSSKRPLVIGSTSYHQNELSLSGVSLIIGSTSCHQEYVLSSERPLLVASLDVDSHYCQTWSAIQKCTFRNNFVVTTCFHALLELFLLEIISWLIIKIPLIQTKVSLLRDLN